MENCCVWLSLFGLGLTLLSIVMSSDWFRFLGLIFVAWVTKVCVCVAWRMCVCGICVVTLIELRGHLIMQRDATQI